MNFSYFDLTNLKSFKLIKDVVVHPLKVNRDDRGILAETIKSNWDDIYNKDYPLAQNYFSITQSNVARDENQWHVHPTKQTDRFVVPQGKIVLALFDPRENSPTHGLLNLFLMGELEKDKGYYNLLIPQGVYHCFLVVSKKPAMILNFPTALYDSKEEGRISFNKIKLENGTYFSWDKVRRDFKLPAKK